MQKNNRIWELDALRGIMILGVVFIHLCFDLDYFLGVDVVKNPILQFCMDHCGFTFVILSGLCVTLGRRSFRRGLQVFGSGLLPKSRKGNARRAHVTRAMTPMTAIG